MTDTRLLYGGLIIVGGIGLVYLFNKKGTGVSMQTAAIDETGAVPNTPLFGDANFEAIGFQAPYDELGSSVFDYGPGPSTVLPPPKRPPSTPTGTPRKKCTCCPDDGFVASTDPVSYGPLGATARPRRVPYVITSIP